MRAILQRVSEASVTTNEQTIGKIGLGWLVLLGFQETDDDEDIEYVCQKVLKLRLFSDEENKFNLSVQDIKGSLLLVSQFTLYGDCRKGNRPSFQNAAPAAKAETLWLKSVQAFKRSGITVETGQFQANMKISLINDGPVTMILESKAK